MNTVSRNDVVKSIEQFVQKKLPSFTAEAHPQSSFSSLGLDSMDHVQLSAALENTLGIDVDETIAFNYPTVEALADQVLIQLQQQSQKLSA